MSKEKKAEVLKGYDDTLASLFQGQDHPTCEVAVGHAVEVLENEWQIMSDQLQNPSADQDEQMDVVEEDVDME
jgi:hypothetical protein